MTIKRKQFQAKLETVFTGFVIPAQAGIHKNHFKSLFSDSLRVFHKTDYPNSVDSYPTLNA